MIQSLHIDELDISAQDDIEFRSRSIEAAFKHNHNHCEI